MPICRECRNEMASVLVRAGGRTCFIYECPTCRERLDENGRRIPATEPMPGKDDSCQ